MALNLSLSVSAMCIQTGFLKTLSVVMHKKKRKEEVGVSLVVDVPRKMKFEKAE